MDRLKRSAVLACDGFRAGESIVPPFEVGPGEIVKIVFSSRHSNDMHIAERLLCTNAYHNVHAATVRLAMQRSWWRELIHRQTASEWIIANCGMTRQDAVAKLNHMRVNPDAPLCQLAGNPRWMIGFVAAMSNRPAALIFTTTGCDPMGMQRALQAVRSQLEDTAAVYLNCFPELKITEPEYAATLHVTVPERTMVA